MTQDSGIVQHNGLIPNIEARYARLILYAYFLRKHVRKIGRFLIKQSISVNVAQYTNLLRMKIDI